MEQLNPTQKARRLPSACVRPFLRQSFRSHIRPRLGFSAAVFLLLALFAAGTAHAQRGSSDLGMGYTQEYNKFVGPQQNNSFYLRGAFVDYGYSFWRGLGLTASASGFSATNLKSTIDIHQIDLLGGLRYTYNWGHITPAVWARHAGLFVEAKGGYTFATSGLYPVNGTLASTATGLTYAAGGGFNFHIYQRFDLRLIQADYVVSHLPNGSTNQQNSVRIGAGVNFHFGP